MLHSIIRPAYFINMQVDISQPSALCILSTDIFHSNYKFQFFVALIYIRQFDPAYCYVSYSQICIFRRLLRLSFVYFICKCDPFLLLHKNVLSYFLFVFSVPASYIAYLILLFTTLLLFVNCTNWVIVQKLNKVIIIIIIIIIIRHDLGLIDLFRPCLIVSSQVFHVVFVHFVDNSALFWHSAVVHSCYISQSILFASSQFLVYQFHFQIFQKSSVFSEVKTFVADCSKNHLD